MTRVLTLRELNRTALARQLLLRRARVRVTPAIERLAGLQAQSAPSPYVALWSRLDGFRLDDLERALRRRYVVKATLMRATLHLVSARDYPLFFTAVRDAQLAMRTRGVEAPPPAAVRRAQALARQRPVTRRDLLQVLGHDTPSAPTVDPRPSRELHWLLTLARLEHSAETAMWSPARSTTFTLRDGVVPDPRAGRIHLVRRYLAAYGPASRADLAQWSGVRMRELRPALEALRLRTFADETGRELLDLPGARILSAHVPAPVRFLPRWDELLLAYDRRERVLADEHRRAVIANNGDFEQTFLVDGFVAGTWRLEQGRVVAEPFFPLPLHARRELEDEARRLEAFLG